MLDLLLRKPYLRTQNRRKSLTKKAQSQAAADTWQYSDHFVALDFETANRFRHSACAISIVTVKSGKVSDVYTRLIRPPELRFEFSYIHGITAADVINAPSYADIHDDIMDLLRDADYVAAHNASFDRSVMTAACNKWGLKIPQLSWQCTVKLARSVWGLYPTNLPAVCQHLGINLVHHDATSDATACARIVVEAARRAPSSADNGLQLTS
jgi:DNA polymerase-3 subunit epsilon